MKIKFGDFEEVETAENLDSKTNVTEKYVKPMLTEFFEGITSKSFKSAYISYPHQCRSEDYSPAESSDEVLEIYLYSLPKDIESTPTDLIRHENFVFNSKTIPPTAGQTDGIALNHGVPKGYAIMSDDTGFTYGVKTTNKVWILFDICHGMGVNGKSADYLLKAIFEALVDEVIAPPSPEELEHRLVEKIQKLVNWDRDAVIESFKKEIKAFEAEAKLQEDRYTLLVRNLSDKYSQLELNQQRKSKDGKEILEKVRSFSWVKRMFIEKGMLTVETSPIGLGPYNYGEWKIQLGESLPAMQHEAYMKQLHPYEWSDRRGYCLGGFADAYIKSMHSGALDKALAIARMEITNYSVDTKMTIVEKFLSKIMGKKFEKIQDDIRHEKFKDGVENIMISSINGTEVTYVGIRGSPDGSYAQTGQRVVIDYGE